jgi:23S rRNA (uridine2552-2'-O)-methyltransferase
MKYRRKDTHYRRARAAGYRARSAYKLEELDRRFGLLRAGDFVIDLGAWPGAWLQMARKRVGSEGRLVGVDLAAITPLSEPNVLLVQGDIRDPSTLDAACRALGRSADVLLSDLAPKLSGIRVTDQAREEELANATLEALPRLLRPGGRFVMKLFMGPGHARVLTALRETFRQVDSTRPEATRRGSAELYVVGRDHLPAGPD